uniref:zinc ribbon domain-containing protein n=1 Tax=Acetatifactor sp. TaxID=1872090 RepID=UPI004055CCE0
MVTKPCPTYNDDAKQQNLKYDVKDFILHNYQILYRKSVIDQYVPIRNNEYLKDGVSAYAVGSEGFWYVQKDNFYYLVKETGKHFSLGKVKNIANIEVLHDGKVRLYQLLDIKEKEHNRFYSRQMGDYEGYEDEYEITLKNIIFDPAKYANRFRGWSQTFTCPRCKAPLYSGMENCPHCGTYLGDTSNASDAYEYEIHSENWLMKKPEGKEHYFQMLQKRPGEWLLNYHVDAGSRRNSTAIYNDWLGERVYSISRNFVNGKKTLVELSVHSTDKIELAHIEDGTLSVTDCGIFVVSKGKKSTTISWLTHDGKFKKNITLPGDITQTYLCGDLVFYLRKEINNWDILNSAYWMDLNDEQEYCIIRAEKKKIRANAKHSEYVNSTHIGAETILGNELGAVIKLHFMYADNADCVSKAEQVFHETEGWYYYSFEEKNMHCLSSPARGPHNAYFKPEEYTQWKDDYFDNHSHNLDIAAFNMEKNLMWVMIQKKGKICWAPMNITTDPLKQLRPDLPIWQNPPCGNLREVVYFDGQHCYAYMGDSPFASIDAKGQREEWPIRYYAVDAGSFVVSEDCIMIEGKLQGNLNSIPGYSVLAQKTVEGIGAFVFPASHKFEKIKGSVQFE